MRADGVRCSSLDRQRESMGVAWEALVERRRARPISRAKSSVGACSSDVGRRRAVQHLRRLGSGGGGKVLDSWRKDR